MGGLARSHFGCPFGPHPTLVCGDHLAAERQVGESASPRLNASWSIDRSGPEIKVGRLQTARQRPKLAGKGRCHKAVKHLPSPMWFRAGTSVWMPYVREEMP